MPRSCSKGLLLGLCIFLYGLTGGFCSPTALLSSQGGPNYFTDITLNSGITNLVRPEWGDWDGDGRLDLYLGGTIYRNDGGAAFSPLSSVSPGRLSGGTWGDYDRDGDLDLLVIGDTAVIYRNLGGGVFTHSGVDLGRAGTGAWGDYDNDGRLDLILVGGFDFDAMGLYHNNGDGSFVVVTNTGLPKMSEAAVAWGDFDNDGRLDLLVNGLTGGPISWVTDVYRNNGDGTFTLIDAGLFGVTEGSVAIGDYNNDGWLDLLTTGFNFGRYILRVYRNEGNLTFADLNLELQGAAFGEANWADFDNDGYLDIFIDGCAANSCDASIAAIYRNNRDDTFSDANAGLTIEAHQARTVSWGDFDNDGDLDLFFKALLRNNSVVSNSPPLPPTGLQAVLLPDNDVELHWSPASDLQNTNAAGLSYALRVGTAPAGVDLVSPQADPATGFRRLPERGPLNSLSTFLRDVPRGKYYWSVQAIDSGFAGSPFAAEGTFEITNARPVVAELIADYYLPPNQPSGLIQFRVFDADAPSSELQISVTSSNTALLSMEQIIIGGSGSDRTISFTPRPDQVGETEILVTVRDTAGGRRSYAMSIHVEQFTRWLVRPLFGSGHSVGWADFDNDNDLDLLVAGIGSSPLLRNDGNGVFMEVSRQNTFVDSTLALADYDCDGKLDYASAGFTQSPGTTHGVFLYQGNGDLSFNRSTLSFRSTLGWQSNPSFGALVWNDFNQDGAEDLLVTGGYLPSGGGFSSVYVNYPPSGQFPEFTGLLPRVGRSAAAWADFNGDGWSDVILSGATNASGADSALTGLYLSERGTNFVLLPTALPDLMSTAMAAGDFDSDGDLDVALSGTTRSSNLFSAVFRHDTGDAFADIGATLLPVTAGVMSWADYNNDGRLDLLVAGDRNLARVDPPGATRLYRNDGNLGLHEALINLPNLASCAAAWGDYDNDGDLDLAFVGGWDLKGSLFVFRNNELQQNTPPSQPDGLRAHVTSNEVRLVWNSSSDLETPTMGLTYNLRVSTWRDSGDIVASESSSDGFRRLPQPGNVGAVTNKLLRNLFRGTYYWNVQAVDSSLRGSSFSTQGVFVIEAPLPPSLAPIADLTLLDNAAPTNITLYGVNQGDSSPPPTLRAVTDNPDLIRIEGAFFNTQPRGIGTLRLAPQPDAVGSATVTVGFTVGAGPDLLFSQSFKVVVVDTTPAQILFTYQSGTVNLLVRGDPDLVYVLEASTNLTSWSGAGRNLRIDANGMANLSFQVPPAQLRQFYRLRRF